MKAKLFAMAAVLAGAALALQSVHAQGIIHHHSGPPACEPGFKIIEEIVYQDVTRACCKMVPNVQKKWVYETIDAPYCVRDTRHGECPNCSGPYCRQLLVKKQIELPCPGTKCVTEIITERVAVTVYRKVPCGPTAVGPIAVEEIPVKPLPKK